MFSSEGLESVRVKESFQNHLLMFLFLLERRLQLPKAVADSGLGPLIWRRQGSSLRGREGVEP